MNLKTEVKKILSKTQFKAFIYYVNKIYGDIRFNNDENNAPVIYYDNRSFKGFEASSKELVAFNLIRKYLPHKFPDTHYRIVRDLITRYIYPHMLPAEKPPYPRYQLVGFHGQHKDAIPDLKDKVLKKKLTELFSVKNDDIIINGGAYLGFGDIKVSSLNPNGLIIAVEAEKKCYEILSQNIEMNKITNVIPLNRALWYKKDFITLSTSGLQANSLIEPIVQGDSGQKVECISIDDIAEQYSLKKVDFVSLTLNGAEVEAIDGMKKTLTDFKPRIRLAGWYFRDNKPIWKLTGDKLKKYGYNVVVGKHGSVLAYKD